MRWIRALNSSMPKFLVGMFRNALKIADDEVTEERGWKLFLMIPRMLLHRRQVGVRSPRRSYSNVSSNSWRVIGFDLIEAREQCDDKAAVSRRRSRRRVHEDDLEKRVARAELLCHLGELSSGRQALKGATLAPGNSDTLGQLKDPTRRPPRPPEPLPHNVVSHVPGRVFELDEQLLSHNLRSARCGAAAGPSGMTTEHLRLLCSDMRTLHVFFQVAEKFARGEIPESVVQNGQVGQDDRFVQAGRRRARNCHR